ncbi:serine hydrolase domain-containing protein [Spirillospora sp. NPDC047279]|uniref:serine hydrolase domain-containing protein n=1 Tax=Spirillospora sp. NPDC047279 TaxID=3155478 RepID=UPI0033D1D04A
MTEQIVRRGFEPVRDLFTEIAARRPGVNAALAAYVGGERVVDLWTGPTYRADSIQGVYSATKGAAGLVLALLIQRGLVDPDAPVAGYWPEFAAAGKESVTVRALASHQAGLINVDGGYTLDEFTGHASLAERLAAQRPFWEPGSGHGYHALTIGTLLNELCLRVTGLPLGEYFRREVAEPYGVDFFIGLPASEEPRVVPSLPIGIGGDGPSSSEASPLFLQAMNIANGTTERRNLLDLRSFRAAGIASIGGFGSARGLARMYAVATQEVDGRPPLLTPEIRRGVAEVQVAGQDLVLPFPTSYAMVFESLVPTGGPGAFGHSGANGALAYADPDLGLAFGYTTDTPSPTATGGADPVTVDLSRSLAAAIGALRTSGS